MHRILRFLGFIYYPIESMANKDMKVFSAYGPRVFIPRVVHSLDHFLHYICPEVTSPKIFIGVHTEKSCYPVINSPFQPTK